MSDHERGAYSPQNEGPQSFDARQSRGGGGGFPTTLVVSLVILAALIVAIVLFYRSGVRSSGEGPGPIGTPVGQMKAPAPASGQAGAEATGLQIYKTEGAAQSGAPPAPAFSPPPEQPQPRPTAPVVVRPDAAAAGATAPAKSVQAAPKDEIGALIEDADKPAKPKPVKAAKPAVAAAAATATVKPAAAPAVAGGVSAQIGAYSSEALAAKGWSDTAAAFGSDMSGKGKHFEPVTKDGTTLYRAAVTGFASKAAAQAFCVKLKAAGHACIVK